MKATETRRHLLEAASRILTHDGSVHLTIAGVAKAAGVSKGCVLYHFPSKAALIEALVRYNGELMDSEFERLIAAAAPGPGRVLRAWLELHTHRPPMSAERHLDLMGLIAREPALHAIITEHRRQQLERLQTDAADADLALLVAFAAEGLGFAEILGPELIGEATKLRLLALARRLSHATEPGRPAADD